MSARHPGVPLPDLSREFSQVCGPSAGDLDPDVGRIVDSWIFEPTPDWFLAASLPY